MIFNAAIVDKYALLSFFEKNNVVMCYSEYDPKYGLTDAIKKNHLNNNLNYICTYLKKNVYN